MRSRWIGLGCILVMWAGLAADIGAQEGQRGALLARIRDRMKRFRGGGPASGAVDTGGAPAAERTKVGGVDAAVWRPAARGPAPLVIFSHGFHGTATQSTFLCSALAAQGYLVIAPEHRDSIRGSMGRGLEGWKAEVPLAKFAAWNEDTYRDRRDDVLAIVDALKTAPEWAGAVDWSRFGLAGHSLGCYTVLGLAGAWPSWKLPGVKCVLALSPYAQPFTSHHTLGGVNVPVMYQSGTRDPGITPFMKKADGIYDQTRSPVVYVEIDGATHFTFSDLSKAGHEVVLAYSMAFLDRYLKGDARADPTRRLAGIADLRVK